MDVSSQVAENMDELFKKFNDGYISTDDALRKLSVWKNEYSKFVAPVPEILQKLDGLVKKLFSQIENYFIYYKRANRENPVINVQIFNIRNKIYKEVVRLQYI